MDATKPLLLLTIGMLLTLSASAQKDPHRELRWNSASNTVERDQGPLLVTFDNARVDLSRQQLPYYGETVKLGAGTTDFSIFLQNALYEPLSGRERAALPGLGEVDTEPEVHTHLAYQRKQPYGLVSIYPYRRSSSSGQIEKLLSFDLQIVETRGGKNGGAPKSYPAHSVLASGDWFRFTLTTDGVYELTYDFMEDLGVDLGGLASDQINLYGEHNGQLPYVNAQLPPTDLRANAIRVEDGGDGQFGPGDRIVFYATGPQRWDLDTVNMSFQPFKNNFTDSACYFIGIGVEPPVRLADAVLSSDAPDQVVTSFNERQFYEKDLVNLIKSGREFYGEAFDIITNYNFQFNVPNVVSSDTTSIRVGTIARTLGTTNASDLIISIGSILNQTWSVTGVNNSYIGAYARPDSRIFEFTGATSPMNVSLTFVKDNPVTSLAWLDQIVLNTRRELKFVGDQLLFRDLRSVGAGIVSEFRLDNAQFANNIWEITDPRNARNIPFTDNGQIKSFVIGTDSLRQFVAFRNTGLLTPTPIGRVQNQDLHATILPTDLVIVTPPQFMSEAMRLADARSQEGLEVKVVQLQHVFNEFSSGMRDATAIKRYMKLLYDRAGSDPFLMPRYLLLFGDGSYNNIVQTAANQNVIPTYQSPNSYDFIQSYCADDYFGLLDDNEGEYTGDLVDIGIGRLPASNLDQARAMVNKLLNYDRLRLIGSAPNAADCNVLQETCVKDWRNRVLFISDDQEGDTFEGTVHMSQSETLASRVENESPAFMVDRIFMDAYQQISTPGGERYPDATEAFKNKVQKGLLLVNYIGHGGEVGWGHERFLDVGTILNWSNSECLPLFMTATCEFTRWDDPGRTSAGEYVILNANGGGIGLMTTTRLAFSNSNFTLSNDFYDHVFEELDELGRTQRLGDVFRRTKIDIATSSPNSTNHRNFCFMGDPSTILAMPRERILTTSITDTAGNPIDTLKALSHVRVNGIVTDANGQQINDFNGVVIPTMFDKKLNIQTLANDGGLPYQFNLWKNVIYRGQASVTDGAFSFDFVVPKDIAYQFAPGRIAYYAESLTANAHGYSSQPIVGGTDANALADDQGPTIKLYMNDENFVNGGITNESPLLVAEVFDVNGINTLGNSIGHDIKAIIDEDTERSVILNDFYEADLDTYQSGKVRYKLEDLAEGPHNLSLKVWDVHNNSSTAFTEFVVAPSAELALAHVLNYPNPFTTHTEFQFEHNKACAFLDVQVQVFTVSGRLVKTLGERVHSDGFRPDPIAWDGRDEYGDKLGRGVYIYRLNVVTPEGEKADKLEKLVILR